MSVVSTELLIKYVNADASSLMSFKSENIHTERLNYSSYCWRTVATERVWGVFLLLLWTGLGTNPGDGLVSCAADWKCLVLVYIPAGCMLAIYLYRVSKLNNRGPGELSTCGSQVEQDLNF